MLGYDLTNYAAHKMKLVYSREVAWGISAQMYVVYYVLIILVLAVLSYFMEKKFLLISILACLVFALIVFPVLDSYPYRGGVVIFIGVAGIFINYLFWYAYRRMHAA